MVVTLSSPEARSSSIPGAAFAPSSGNSRRKSRLFCGSASIPAGWAEPRNRRQGQGGYFRYNAPEGVMSVALTYLHEHKGVFATTMGGGSSFSIILAAWDAGNAAGLVFSSSTFCI